MKWPLALTLGFALGTSVQAEAIAVFGKNQIALVQPGQAITAVPDDAAQQAFLFAFEDWSKAPRFDNTLPLVSPPEWGKTIPRSGGEVKYEKNFARGFVAHLSVQGLAPHHLYLLTLNGTPHQPGNELLLDPVPGLADERFYDFLRVRTNDAGAYVADLAVYLKPGPYHVRIYVKDTDDFKIVLYRDFFDFVAAPNDIH